MSDIWQEIQGTLSFSTRSLESPPPAPALGASDQTGLWAPLDGATIVLSAALAAFYKFRRSPLAEVKGFWHGTLIPGRSMSILLGLLLGYACMLFLISRRLNLYAPLRLNGFLHEQGLSIQASLYSGLLLTGSLYLLHAEDISRGVVLLTIGLVTVSLSLRRLAYRLALYRRFERGEGTRHVLIVGTGPEAQAVRLHLESLRHLGYTFKGFIESSPQPSNTPPGSLAGGDGGVAAGTNDVVGTIESLFQNARKQFVDEIFFATPCDREMVRDVLSKARTHGIDLRVVPETYGNMARNSSIEYIGKFPTIPLYCGRVPEAELLLKRAMDLLTASLGLLVLSPLLLLIALAVKMDSHGPILYLSERIGKKGRVFRCVKFRTMVRDADTRRAEIEHMNERDGVLFKISNDPRITAVGRFLRRYSLDELPQLINVLLGEMSVVGPRPPLASEVREYKLSHLRRLDVTPGITGLWQVQARQNPSFDQYISLDVTYVETWSIWLDLKILARTVAVVVAGTGS